MSFSNVVNTIFKKIGYDKNEGDNYNDENYSNVNFKSDQTIVDISYLYNSLEIEEIANDAIVYNDAPFDTSKNIKENLLESILQKENKIKAINRLDFLERVSTTTWFKKSSKEKIIESLNNSIKDKEKWKENIIEKIFNIHNENNSISEYEILEFINDFEQMNKYEFSLIIKLISILKVVKHVQLKSLSITNKITNNCISLKNFNDIYQPVINNEYYFVLFPSVENLLTKFDLALFGTSYKTVSEDMEMYTDFFNIIETAKGRSWIIILEKIFPEQINKLVKSLIEEGFLQETDKMNNKIIENPPYFMDDSIEFKID